MSESPGSTASAPFVEHRRRVGLSPRGELVFGVGSMVLASLFLVGWAWAVLTARSEEPGQSLAAVTASVSRSITSSEAPSVAYVTDAALNAIVGERGSSGKLRVEEVLPGSAISTDSLPAGAKVHYVAPGDVSGGQPAPAKPGLWKVALAVGNAIQPIADFSLIALHPFSEKRNGRVGPYYLGNWPFERGKAGPGKAPPGRYANPRGFIEVTQQNETTHVSEHFRLMDFLTHDQVGVWPKYLVLEMRNVDKLELVLADLKSRGVNISGIKVMSGFRTPQYNAGGGNTGGRAGLSRHMYGDAADVYIDSDGNGVMDDLNHDGRISIDDSRVMLAAVDRVEQQHPELVGGAGVYPAGPGHGPFIHIDSRGYRARWTGSPGGG